MQTYHITLRVPAAASSAQESGQKLLMSWVPLHAVPSHTVSARLEQAAMRTERAGLRESNAVPPQGRPQEQ